MEKIILSKYVNYSLGDRFNVKYSITKLNKSILDFCMAILDYDLTSNDEELKEALENCCSEFATCMHYTYINDTKFCAELMQNMRKGSSDILDTFKNKQPIDAARTIAYEIGIISESDTNYTVADRMILVFTAARKFGFKFDFSWNL
jgi:hypothetical protein